MATQTKSPTMMIPTTIKQMDPNKEIIPKAWPKIGPGPKHQPAMLATADKNVTIVGK